MAESRLRPMELRWRGARLRASTPIDFRGDPDPWTPTHAVMAGIANCLTTTFLALAHSSGLLVIPYRVRVGAIYPAKRPVSAVLSWNRKSRSFLKM